MTTEQQDRRSVLEGIAFGDDPRVTPADRLRAIAELRELDPPPDDRHIALSAGELATFEDSRFAMVLAALAERVAGPLQGYATARDDELFDLNEYQLTAGVLEEELRLRVEQRVRELVDVGLREQEIEERARELAGRLYGAVLSGRQIASDGREGAREGEVPSEQSEPRRSPQIDPPPGIDLAAGWPQRPQYSRWDRRGLR